MADNKAWHTLSIEDTFAALETDPYGLTGAEVAKRLEKYGPNEIATEDKINWLELLFDQIKNPLVVVLIIAAVIAFLAGETIDTIVIFVVIVLNTLIGFFQEYRAEQALEALRARAAPQAEVIRCIGENQCSEKNVKAQNIVPGDIIVLSAGDRAPADARLLEAVNLEVDEAMLTGESLPVRKNIEPLEGDLPVADRTNLVYGGTVVTGGRGKAVVYATGLNTEMGGIATLIQETEKAVSPIQKQTLELGKRLGFLAVLAGALILLVGLIRGLGLDELFLFVIAAVVSMIPEGLPAVMTITLAVGVNRMAKRNSIIRKLQAVDSLGATTVICTDKTGTLTTNQMTVQQIFTCGRVFHVTGSGYSPEGEFKLDEEPFDPQEDEALRLTLQIAALCNDSRLAQSENENDSRWEIRGDPTEGALVVAAKKAGLEKPALENKFPRIDEIPFDSKRKYMATFHETPEGRVGVYLKGAPEVLLELCSRVKRDGDLQELDVKTQEDILAVNEEMAGAALRVLAVAYQEIEHARLEAYKNNLAEGREQLVFAGLLGMLDPPRPEAKEAVERCQRAGIKVIMATGDNKITGEAIAREVGIFDDNGRVITGPEVERMSAEELDAVIQETVVFARVSPEHKQRIVASLQRHEEVVAMTGDGINDAPALKGAEIGVAMGITGTDVTKETAEMVLTDDNFASIVNAVEEGRVVFMNVRKVVKFLISTNVGEILTILGALVLLPAGQLIFTPVQILWVNLVTDGLLDITIALEPKEGDVMDQPPRQPDTPIINREILLIVVFVATIMAIGTLGIYFWGLETGNSTRAQTLAFITIAMFQVFNSLNVRSRTQSLFQIGPFTNKYLIAAIITSVALLFLATTVPFLQLALSTIPLNLQDWGIIFLVTSSIFFLDEIRKIIHRRIINK